MAISTENRKAGPFSGDGSITVFPFDFKVFKTEELSVVVADANGAESTLILGTDYSVMLQSDQNAVPGGVVTLVSPLATFSVLAILSKVPYLQPTEITNLGNFYPAVINNSLDRVTILAQQLLESQSRALTYPVTVSNFNPSLPFPKAGHAIGYNSSASGFANVDITGAVQNANTALATANSANQTAASAKATADKALSTVQGNIPVATETTAGIVILENSLNSGSETKVLTAKQGKTLNDGKLGINDTAKAAKKLETAVKINGVDFDGSKDIDIKTPKLDADNVWKGSQAITGDVNITGNLKVSDASKLPFLGVNQKYTDVTSKRSTNTTYTNTSKFPMYIIVDWEQAQAKYISLLIDNRRSGFGQQQNIPGGGQLTGIIPVGSSYSINTDGQQVKGWYELYAD